VAALTPPGHDAHDSQSQQSASLEVATEGCGQPLQLGQPAKGEFVVSAPGSDGQEVLLEKSPFSGPLGCGVWHPAIEVRLLVAAGCAKAMRSRCDGDTCSLVISVSTIMHKPVFLVGGTPAGAGTARDIALLEIALQ
jgi:hypothetical protein